MVGICAIGAAALLLQSNALSTFDKSHALVRVRGSIYPASLSNRFAKSGVRIFADSQRNDGLDDMRVDMSKLSESERERLDYIQKISLEAEQMIRDAGINAGSQNKNYSNEIEKAVKDTQWTGQSDAEEAINSNNNWTDVQSRPILLVGDTLALITFAIIGRSNHGESTDILSDIITALPFIISWLAVSPFCGAFSREATASLGKVAVGISTGWAASTPLALAMRGILKGEAPPLPFVIVSAVATFLLLAVWRCLYILAFGETSNSEYRKAGALEIFKMVGNLVRRW